MNLIELTQENRMKKLIPILLLIFAFAGCATFNELPPAGQFDIAKEAAVSTVEELKLQMAWVVQDRVEGVTSQEEAVRQFSDLSKAMDSLVLAIDAATLIFESGGDPLDASEALLLATDTARKQIRRRVR